MNLFYFFSLSLLFFIPTASFGQDPQAIEYADQQQIDLPKFQTTNNQSSVTERSITKLPTVVHVIYLHEFQDLTDFEVEDAIKNVNKDFRRQNPDTVNTPDAFKPFAADTRIEFELATIDPSGQPTNGITHTQTFWTEIDMSTPPGFTWLYYDSLGGKNAWDTEQYVNIWLFSHYVIGAWPGQTYSINAHGEPYDGVIVSTALPLYQRVITHELGHYLGLGHSWGLEGICPTGPPPGGNDGLADTPDQLFATSNCPEFPQTDICTPDFPGIMFMNYMDYSSSDCKNLFTHDQAALMKWVIDSIRFSLLDPISSINDSDPGFDVSLYPNPVKDELTLDLPQPLMNSLQLAVYDGSGRIVCNKELPASFGGKTMIDVSHLSKGIYTVKATSGKYLSIDKFVKL